MSKTEKCSKHFDSRNAKNFKNAKRTRYVAYMHTHHITNTTQQDIAYIHNYIPTYLQNLPTSGASRKVRCPPKSGGKAQGTQASWISRPLPRTATPTYPNIMGIVGIPAMRVFLLDANGRIGISTNKSNTKLDDRRPNEERAF